MRQRDDSHLTDVLNNVFTWYFQLDDINILKSKVIKPGAEDNTHNRLHIFVKNANANGHYNKMLNSSQDNLLSEKATENLPQHTAQDKTDKVLKKIKVGALQEPFRSN